MTDTVYTFPAPSAAMDLVVEKLPPVFRIQSIERFPFDHKNVRSRATLYHDRAAFKVEWLSSHVDPRLTVGGLVAVRWCGRPVSLEGAVRIARLVLLEKPDPEINLFENIPHRWVRDRNLAKRGAALWEALPRGFRHLFNAVFWDGGRFQRYVTGPNLLNGYQHTPGGNLRHSIEVAERALELAASDAAACARVLILAALLHDAGKADEYRMVQQGVELSDRGRLVGHRHTVIEWIAAARACYRVIVPEADYLALLHALTCVKGAPPWLGLREPQRVDATILQVADHLAVQRELRGRAAPFRIGFEHFRPQFGMRPIVPPPAV